MPVAPLAGQNAVALIVEGTESSAPELTTAPTEFATRAVYTPVFESATLLTVYVAPVAPVMFTPLRCHWMAGGGLPLAATVNVTFPPTVVLMLTGCVVITGFVFTVSRAALLVAVPALFVSVTV
jgi:hypothetical protein